MRSRFLSLRFAVPYAVARCSLHLSLTVFLGYRTSLNTFSAKTWTIELSGMRLLVMLVA